MLRCIIIQKQSRVKHLGFFLFANDYKHYIIRIGKFRQKWIDEFVQLHLVLDTIRIEDFFLYRTFLSF